MPAEKYLQLKTKAEQARPKPCEDKQIINFNACDLSLTNHWLETISKQLHEVLEIIKVRDFKFKATRSAVREQQ